MGATKSNGATWSDDEIRLARHLRASGMTSGAIARAGLIPGRTESAIRNVLEKRLPTSGERSDEIELKPFAQLSALNQRTLRRLLFKEGA